MASIISLAPQQPAGAQPANPAVKAGDRVGILGSDIVGKVVSISTRGEVSVKPDGVRLWFRI